MNKSGQKSKETSLPPPGFTIIETLIVLAIAGIILLIVFQAIPALQRNGRNNQRKQDIQTILGAVSHYEINDSGKFPDNCGDTSQPLCTASGGSTVNDYFLQYVKDKLTYYRPDLDSSQQIILYAYDENNPADVNNPGPRPSDGGYYVPTTNRVIIYNYYKCNSDGSGLATQNGAGYSDVVALYALESGDGVNQIKQCQQL